MKKALITALAAALIGGTVSSAQAAKVSDLNLDITGTAQIGYLFSQAAGVADQQDVNRLRLKISAQPADKISFFTQAELGANQTTFGIQGTNPLAATGVDSRLVDAYVKITYLPWVTVVAGQSPSPASYELGTDEYSLETINYSQLVGNFLNRDRGLGAILPITDNVKALAWINNGTGAPAGANTDGEDTANYGAMLSADPVKDLNVKVWGNVGKSTVAPSKNTAIGLGADYKIYGWHFAAEYGQNSNKNAGVTTKSTDWYVHGAYTIPETGVQLVARYDKFDPSKLVTGNELKITTVGVNWDFEKNARLQLMEELKGETPSVKNNTTMVQLSVRF